MTTQPIKAPQLASTSTNRNGGGVGNYGNYGDIERDDLFEGKYNEYYVESLDPFQLVEIDKYIIMNKLNFFERNLAFMTKYIIQDVYSRHVFLVYLFVVHAFAIMQFIRMLKTDRSPM